MALENLIAGPACTEDDCPQIGLATDGMVDVQGYIQSQITTPDGEAVVRIPAELIMEAARALGRQ
ncbi:hypothetical protein [Actinomadura atramentaria]|uniref:hypothetical protein n=1 Tax=Actinomadura atramentaria TaxID=1990 RepID=UPI00036F1863|nr:hypothetical protein [Actinomadura atramentaria]